ncbi:hypothetical protein [uncultured Litoreibacter sp.]|uniref:hypothetical protein n=1 Tax=uncultured Litoreibacter sp. TaxID=1392394 RepID=UPI0026253BF6|nr:hypothetical protein [uncultured Litoreibacter sp.]
MNAAPLSGQLDFQLMHQDDRLRVEVAPGRSGRLMVSFTSVGTERDQWPPKEFVKQASQDGRNHLICITDKSRCWMNHTGMDQTILRLVADYVAQHEVRNIMTLGVSMGAFNALVFGRLMPVQRVIAFAPQFSVHPDIVPEETRWTFFRNQITDWRYRALDKLPKRPAKIYMFHGDSRDEQHHWRQFPTAPNLRHYIFAGRDHNFVRQLKSENLLPKIMISAIRDDAQRMDEIVRSASGMERADYDHFEGAVRHFAER